MYALSQLRNNWTDLQEEGIFRIPGSVSDVQACRAEFDAGRLPTLPPWDVATACSIIHNFLNNATDSYWHGLGQELAAAEGKIDEDISYSQKRMI